MRPPLRVAAVVHLYYAEQWPELARLLGNLPAGADLFVTLPEGSTADAAVRADFPRADIRHVPNVGRDVAPFLALLPDLVAYDVVCKVHSKKQVDRHPYWRRECLAGVLGSRQLVRRILHAFAVDDRLMLAGPRLLYLLGMPHSAECLPQLERMASYLPERFGFFAGTMFWVRPAAVADFAAICPQERFVPHDDSDGHPEHAVERLFGIRAAERGAHVARTDFAAGRVRVAVGPATEGAQRSFYSAIHRQLAEKYAGA